MRVNVAVLSISAPPRGNVPIENIVADGLTEAGHQISAFEAVRDNETAIRAQLVGWLADPDVDAVIVIGDGEHTGAALKPMVDQALPGLAEAVRCGTTFVFVVSGGEGAVKAALEKQILPQFDPKTKPRNLIGSMPRLRDLVEHDVTKVDIGQAPPDVTRVAPVTNDNASTDAARKESAIPTPIPVEKTASGAGVSPKLPAGRAEPVAVKKLEPTRPRSRTGVNVIVRTVEDPTKPIELQKLEEQLELSKDEDKPLTRSQRIARTNLATQPLDTSKLRPPAAPAKPLPSVVRPPTPTPLPAPIETTAGTIKVIDDHTKVDHPTNPETLSVGDATKPLPLAQAIPPVEIKPRSKIAAATITGDVGDTTKPLEGLPKLPPGASEDPDTAEPPKAAPVARIPLKTVAAVKATPPVPAPVVPPARVRQLTPPIPTSVVIPLKQKKPKPEEIETLDLEPDAEPAAEAVDAAKPAVAEAKPAAAAPEPAVVDDDPDVAASHLLDAPRPRRKTTQPPPLSDLITRPPSSSLSDLPAGQFNYPTKRRSKLPLVLLLLVLAAGIGAGAMYFVGHEAEPKVAAVEADAALPVETAIDASVAAIEPDAPVSDEIEMTPPDAAEVATNTPPDRPERTDRPNRPNRPARPGGERPTRPGNTVLPVDKPPPVDKPTGPSAEPGCEEVACVMEKYARPCCARFKPQGETFVPTAANSANLSKAQIRAGVDKLKPRVIACGEQFEAKGKGTVKLSISVTPEGNVSDLSVSMSPDPGLGDCVANALRKAKFEPTKSGGSFTYPFVF